MKIANRASWLIVPPALFIVAVVGVALFIFLRNAFYVSGGMGIVQPLPTLSNVQKLFDPFYAEVLWRTTVISLVVVLLSALIAVPVTLFLRHLPSRRADLYFLIVLASSAMSLVVRALGWISVLNDNGLINQVILATHLTEEPLSLIGTDGAIVAGLVHGFVPIFVLTLYPVMQGIDPALEAASEGLGAGQWVTLRRVLIPLAMPGIAAASLLTFAMCMGAYTTPALLSGGRASVFSILIQQQTMVVLNYPLASALAGLLLIIVMVLIWSSVAASARQDCRRFVS